MASLLPQLSSSATLLWTFFQEGNSPALLLFYLVLLSNSNAQCPAQGCHCRYRHHDSWRETELGFLLVRSERCASVPGHDRQLPLTGASWQRDYWTSPSTSRSSPGNKCDYRPAIVLEMLEHLAQDVNNDKSVIKFDILSTFGFQTNNYKYIKINLY